MGTMGQYRQGWSKLLLLSLLFINSSQAQLSVSYCSPENNAGGYSPSSDEFMSTGLCGDQCQGAFAFAIVQGYNCWCSNYVPAAQQDTFDCNEPCPGISTESCGAESQGLYGYFQLPAGRPLGTSGTGASLPSSTSFSSVSTSRRPSVSPSPVLSSSSSIPSTSPGSPLVTVDPSQSTVQPETPTRSPSSDDTTPSSTEASSTSTSDSPPPPSSSPTSSRTEVYTSVTTVTGQIRTVLVTPTADATLGQSSTSGSGSSAGMIAGIVVGVVLGIALIAAAIVLCMRRRRRRDTSPEGSFTAERMNGNSNVSNNVPSRQVSQLSSAGLLGKAPKIQTNFYPSDTDPRSATTNSSNNLDRRSVATDQRLNPWALYSQDDRNSSVSLQDNQDYSRQLRVANPD